MSKEIQIQMDELSHLEQSPGFLTPQTSGLSLPYGQKYLKTKQQGGVVMTLKSEVSVIVNSCQG